MKQIIFSIGLLCNVILFLGNSVIHPTSSSGGYADAPGDSTCLQCHTNAKSKGKIELIGLPDTIKSGQEYMLKVSILDTAKLSARAGFQMVALNSDDTNAGSFETTNGNNVQIRNAFGRQYLGHKPAKSFDNDISEFKFIWKAPVSSSSESVTFYVSSILGNGKDGNKGDQYVHIEEAVTLETTSTTSTYETIQSIERISSNPIQDELAIKFNSSKTRTFNLVSTNGNLVRTTQYNSTYVVIPTHGIPNGIYLLQITEGQKSLTKKIVLSH